ncbi:MarR family winged helix-turn-helix transcriptional regulator [Dactylosporangium fulvum]|uniref:MarR family transcriptional regulator n=1 Tax=Dactylosporangium fulvum TaxID=53359 RepID=A0ABY5VYH0_9ACTN|nr:hypothetical protein [Dactylosporangium fulvum]UWP81538.1 hypothetical protein Dfulv_41535 [Dactylosporangium fulvum]
MSKPIGYWLKELDGRIEAAFAAVFAAEGLQRRHWQVLNGLGPADPFFGPGERPYAEVAGDLVARGWMTPDGLTEAGTAARDRIAAEVARLRQRVGAGVPDEDYLTTVRTLERMAANLA